MGDEFKIETNVKSSCEQHFKQDKFCGRIGKWGLKEFNCESTVLNFDISYTHHIFIETICHKNNFDSISSLLASSHLTLIVNLTRISVRIEKWTKNFSNLHSFSPIIY